MNILKLTYGRAEEVRDHLQATGEMSPEELQAALVNAFQRICALEKRCPITHSKRYPFSVACDPPQ